MTKYANDWDRMKATKTPFISTTWTSGGYDLEHRNGKIAHWVVYHPTGERWVEDPAETLFSLHHEPYRHVFVTFEEAAAHIVDTFGLPYNGFKRTSQGGYFPDPKGTDIGCGVSVNTGGRASRSSVCDKRRAPGEDVCGMHLTVARKAAEKKQAWNDREVRGKANERIADDAVAALEEIGVKAGVHYHTAHRFQDSGFTGKVTVHAEDILALVRELQELRELKEL